jgi:hypothetical protein
LSLVLNPKKRIAKPIFDEIIRVLVAHYEFTDEELDFSRRLKLGQASLRLSSWHPTTKSSTECGEILNFNDE